MGSWSLEGKGNFLVCPAHWIVMWATVALCAAKQSTTASQRHCGSELQCCQLVDVTQHCFREKSAPPVMWPFIKFLWPFFVATKLTKFRFYVQPVVKVYFLGPRNSLKMWAPALSRAPKAISTRTVFLHSTPKCGIYTLQTMSKLQYSVRNRSSNDTSYMLYS